ncbi:HK97 family phage prohead protease [Fibrella aestuarina]|uniref:HK97 family phage prohead protease n=1 Tax=Fibrella aestuarina TaxID=651143 RepID=UPI0002E22781|nr:HK97 family phage prohead protease [Fibrella aestuarina]
MVLQHKTKKGYFVGSVKDADTKLGIVTGYFASFNTLDSDRDIIRQGAFAKTIAEQGPASSQPRIKHLLDHTLSLALGKLIELKEDTQGLYYESKIGSHDLGIDFLKMVESGLITEHSIGYSVMKGNWDKAANAYELLELKLYEGSSLRGWGANQYTPLTGMKSLADLQHSQHLLDIALKNGTFTDETFLKLKEQRDAIDVILKARDEKSETETTEPESTTQPDGDNTDSLIKSLTDNDFVGDLFKWN